MGWKPEKGLMVSLTEELLTESFYEPLKGHILEIESVIDSKHIRVYIPDGLYRSNNPVIFTFDKSDLNLASKDNEGFALLLRPMEELES